MKKEKATCLEGAQSPFVHDDLANGTCYHYVVTVVTAKGESPESQEVMAIPSPYLLAACIGQEGVDEGEFSSPTGITLDKDGNLYVADTDNHSIQKFDKTGKFVARWGGEPSSQEGNFYYPRGLAVGANDAVYVADSGNNRVQKFDLDGNVMQAWGKFGFAWRGADMGKFDVPWGVATDQEGNLYVSDTSNARIQKFKADGTPLVKWGRDGSFDGAFFFPRGVAVDFVGNIYVADEGNNRVQKFDARGSFLTKWGREGAGPGQFKTPWGIACDALGNVYVVDTGNHRIQKFDGNGTFLCAWGNRGKSEGQLNFPYGIAVDKEGCVYVVDSGNNRVLKYVPTDEEINRGKDEKPKSQATDRHAASEQRGGEGRRYGNLPQLAGGARRDLLQPVLQHLSAADEAKRNQDRGCDQSLHAYRSHQRHGLFLFRGGGIRGGGRKRTVESSDPPRRC